AESIIAYGKALEIRPGYLSASINLAVRYAAENRYDEAIRLYRDVIDR
ncbi:MAG: social gliding motility protein Tgl, partial [Gammaproteobacteria bacterium]|nr:social gliding motility protein Tgl [Gammaproteobacteria bacterium]